MPDKIEQAHIAVAGLICLDIIPELGEFKDGPAAVFKPGKLTTIGSAKFSIGGVVSTGLALHRLGTPVKLMGKLGRDLFGDAVLDILRRQGPDLADDMAVRSDEQTSYTLVFSPPGMDRWFMHCPGANDTFGAADIQYDRLEGVRLFHFGYPPLMPHFYRNGGAELVEMLSRIKEMGITTSLDMVMMDPLSEAAGTDWPALLGRTLPHVDIFLPSLDEILFMLQRVDFQHLQESHGGLTSHADGAMLWQLGGRLIEMGAAVVALKLGDQGLYLRTTSDAARLARVGLAAPADAKNWLGRELLSPCFKATVVGTTGSGDCTIAGFLNGLTGAMSAEQTMTAAVAVGACSVEQADATSGVIPWDAVQRRITAGWQRLDVRLNLSGWRKDADLWIGPHDREYGVSR